MHRLTLDVHIFDTDCYGVMWHGAYLKWLEMGRVELCKSLGLRMATPEATEGYLFPVVEQQLRYRASARLSDPLILTTRVEAQGHKLAFTQVFTHAQTGKPLMEAVTLIVIVTPQWKPYRRLPEDILARIQAAAPLLAQTQ